MKKIFVLFMILCFMISISLSQHKKVVMPKKGKSKCEQCVKLDSCQTKEVKKNKK